MRKDESTVRIGNNYRHHIIINRQKIFFVVITFGPTMTHIFLPNVFSVVVVGWTRTKEKETVQLLFIPQ